MTSKERVSTAQGSDDLGERSTEELADVDIIRASGLAGHKNPLGLAIWRFRYAGDLRETPYIAQKLVGMGFLPDDVAKVLKHLMDDICPSCHGRGYKTITGAPVLSDDLCPSCSGAGRKELQDPAQRDLVELICKHEREVASEIMQRLARRIEF